MDSRYIMDKSSVEARVGIAGADFNLRTGRSVLRDTRVSTMAEKSAAMPVYIHRPVLYKFVMDVESAAEEVKSERSSEKRNGHCPRAPILDHTEKTGVGDQNDTGSTGILKRASPTHCPGMNGQLPGGLKHLDISNPGKQSELTNGFRAAQEQHVRLTERQPLPSSHIPVPRNRLQAAFEHQESERKRELFVPALNSHYTHANLEETQLLPNSLCLSKDFRACRVTQGAVGHPHTNRPFLWAER